MRVAILCNGGKPAGWQRDAVAWLGRAHEVDLIDRALPDATLRDRINEGDFAALIALDGEPFPDGHEPVLLSAITYQQRPRALADAVAKREPTFAQAVVLAGKDGARDMLLAVTETPVVPHSLGATRAAARRALPDLLARALDALATGHREPGDPHQFGRQPPSRVKQAALAARLGLRAVRRMAYGALVEKRWRVSLAEVGDCASPIEALERAAADRTRWTTLPISSRHLFHADAFFHQDGGSILLEALDRRSGRGELVRVVDGSEQRLGPLAGHTSYPCPIRVEGRDYVLPETVKWSSPTLFELAGGALRPVGPLDIDEQALLDPTLVAHDGKVYLFANRVGDGPSVLRLWVADDLFGRFTEHPASPIRQSGRESRMAGPIHRWPAGLFRLGQDFRRSYGDGLVAFRITTLSPTDYAEEEAGRFAFAGIKGPHTLDVSGGRILFDWYRERLSPLAGVRRLLGRVQSRPTTRASTSQRSAKPSAS